VEGKSIFDKLREPKFHLLVFSNSEPRNWKNEFGELVDYHVIPLNSRVSEIFETEKEFSVFLRPDNHIAFISAEISLNPVRDYLNRIAEGV
jgi:hypothetical protein